MIRNIDHVDVRIYDDDDESAVVTFHLEVTEGTAGTTAVIGLYGGLGIDEETPWRDVLSMVGKMMTSTAHEPNITYRTEEDAK